MIDPVFESVLDDAPGTIRCIHRTCRDLSGDHCWHFHPQFELTLIVSSCGTRWVGDHVERYAPGDLVLSGPNLPHCWRNELTGPDDRAEWMVVQFAADFLGAGFLHMPEAAGVRKMLEESSLGIAFLPDVGRLIESHVRDIVARAGLTRMTKLGELLDFLSRVERRVLAHPRYLDVNQIDARLTGNLARVERYIDRKFREEVNQSEIAAELGMSASQFSKFMRAATGRTFMNLVKLARINEACRMLSSGSEQITQIALQCGYQHTSHFDRHFLQLKGVSPREYRRKVRAINADPLRSP